MNKQEQEPLEVLQQAKDSASDVQCQEEEEAQIALTAEYYADLEWGRFVIESDHYEQDLHRMSAWG